MRVIGIIPARAGSKGILGKNYKLLAHKPLIVFSIEAALKSCLDRIVVSTDDKTIARIAEDYGLEVPFMRPPELATDTAKSIDVAKHALYKMEQIDGVRFDAIMLLQPTTPFRTAEDIDQAISMMKNDVTAESVISVVPVEGHHPARMKYLDNGVLIDPPFCEDYENQNRQELKPMYIRNGAIYLTKRETLLKNSYKGNKCLAHIMSLENSVNIDTLFDFEFAEWIYSRKSL